MYDNSHLSFLRYERYFNLDRKTTLSREVPQPPSPCLLLFNYLFMGDLLDFHHCVGQFHFWLVYELKTVGEMLLQSYFSFLSFPLLLSVLFYFQCVIQSFLLSMFAFNIGPF